MNRPRVGGLALLLSLSVVAPGMAQSPAAATAVLTVPTQYPTIQAALDAAAIGDTVSVEPGTYHEKINFNAKNVKLVSTGGAAATVIAAPTGTTVTTVTIGPEASIVGFTITGGNNYFGAGMSVNGIGTLVAKNVFQANIQMNGGFGAAIGGNSASPTITQNVFNDNSCDAQFSSGVVSFVNYSSPTISNNVFRDNPCTAVNLGLPEGPMPRLINNTIVHNSVGVRVDGRVPSTNYIIRNNIIVDNLTGLQVDFGNGPTWDHNLVFANNTNYSGIADPTGTSGNISIDPQFVDASTSDYHLTPTSPPVDAGANTAAPTSDFDGTPRPPDAVDIGAFEFSILGWHQTFNCTIRSTNGNYVSAELGETGPLKGALRARATSVGAWEKFKCVAIDHGRWAFRSRANSRYVAAELDYPSYIYGALRARSTSIGAWENFTVRPVASCARCVLLKSPANQRFVSAELGFPGTAHALMRARSARGSSWETFTIEADAA